MADDLIYNIPLRREWLKVPKYRRTKKAIKAVKEFISKNTKVKDVKVGKYLNLRLWEHGRKNPPHKITVKVTKEKDFVKVELPDAPEEKVEEPKKKRRLFGKKKEVKEETKEEKEKKEILQKGLPEEKLKEVEFKEKKPEVEEKIREEKIIKRQDKKDAVK